MGRGNPGFEYKMKDCTLKEVKEEKNIGVIIHKDLKPSKQCESAVNRARVVLGQLTRLFHFRDWTVFLRLYATYVRPHLEFSTSVWSPTLLQDIRSIEGVQARAINMISDLVSNNYTDKLKELGLFSLETRRKMYDMIQTFKILKSSNREIWLKKIWSQNLIYLNTFNRQKTNIKRLKWLSLLNTVKWVLIFGSKWIFEWAKNLTFFFKF